jgi:phosphopantothenoylcysteine decarboxylase/phosphopantothenate--cysteine ligase
MTPLHGKRVLITAGPTHEKIDPVRFIGNYSSGKMGFALAEECAQRGAEVTLVTGPVTLEVRHPSIRRIDVESAQQMYDAAVASFPAQDAAILCAAVADYRPEHTAEKKIKREKPQADTLEQCGATPAEHSDDLLLHLVPNPDIAAALGRMKKAGQRLVGFALETDNEVSNAKEKMERKNLDAIVLNSLRNDGTCFQSDQNQISIFTSDGQVIDYPKKDKASVAVDIIDQLENMLLR